VGAHDPEASRASTLIGLAELALSGCTTVFDHSYVFKNGNNVDCQIEAAPTSACASMPAADRCRSANPKRAAAGRLREEEAFILKDSQRVIEHTMMPQSAR